MGPVLSKKHSQTFQYKKHVRLPVLKRIMFRTNIRRNSSAEYSAETDVAKPDRIRTLVFYRILGVFPNIRPNIRQ